MARSATAGARGRSRVPDRPSSLRLWLRRRRNLLRPAGLSVLGLVVLALVGLAVNALSPAAHVAAVGESLAGLGASMGFTVHAIEVEGRRNTPMELVRMAVNANRGDPILDFSPAEARTRLETLAWVESASVERHLPGTIVVKLTERTPFAIWQNQGRFSVIDRDGRVISTEQLGAFGPLPLVVGAGADRTAGALIEQLRTQPEVMVRTQAMVRVGERRWNLHLHNGMDVLLPEGHEAAAITRLAELQNKDALLDRPLAAVDMRLPDKLVLRPQAAPEVVPAAAARGRNARG